MPRCLMAKKWKAYPWPNREGDQSEGTGNEEEDEEIDVVGDANETDPTARGWAPVGAVPAPSTWGPSSPTAGATAPSPPPNQSGSTLIDGASRVAVLYSDHVQDPVHYTAYLPQTYHDDGTRRTYTTLQTEIEQQRQSILVSPEQSHASPPIHRWTEKKYQVLTSVENKSEIIQDISGHGVILIAPPSSEPQEKTYAEYGSGEKVESPQDDTPKEAPPVATPPGKAKKSLSMCYTSTGAALSLPPKKKDIYRPYSLDDRPTVVKPKPRALVITSVEEAKQQEGPAARPYEGESLAGLTVGRMVEVRESQMGQEQESYCCKNPADYQSRERVDQENYYEERYDQGYQRDDPYNQREERSSYQYEDRSFERYSRPAEDISAAHAILDLSASTSILPASVQESNNQPVHNPERVFKVSTPVNKTVAYTYEAFFVSDGRSKKKPTVADVPSQDGAESKAKYTCSECGKQYATSSNLSRHKQTHRSLDSQSAKKCMTCGKAYVSMPALAMHLLTHKLSHGCGVCGKLFSRPWLLQGHLRSHTGEKPYGCAHCGKAFADRSNLRAHMQTHSIDKNYVCMRCNKSFALKSYLNKHLESACFKDNTKDGDAPAPAGNASNASTTGAEVSPLTPPQSPSPIYSYSL